MLPHPKASSAQTFAEMVNQVRRTNTISPREKLSKTSVFSTYEDIETEDMPTDESL
jgi:hypothetical protein